MLANAHPVPVLHVPAPKKTQPVAVPKLKIALAPTANATHANAELRRKTANAAMTKMHAAEMTRNAAKRRKNVAKRNNAVKNN